MTTAIKTQIIDQFPQFEGIAKVADVQAEVSGQTIRVKIKKGEAKVIKVNKQVVWKAKEANETVIEALSRLTQPARADFVATAYTTVEMADEGYEEKLEALAGVAPQPIKMLDHEPKKVRASKVTAEWIETLTEEANKSARLKEGHSIKLRVATSHGKPVTAAVDIYRGDEKIGTGGRQKKINFATKGINEAWKGRVDEAVEFAYSKINK